MRPRAIALRAASICEVVGYACRCRLLVDIAAKVEIERRQKSGTALSEPAVPSRLELEGRLQGAAG